MEDRLTDGSTCCHKENSSTEQDVVPGAVDSSDTNTQAAQHQQDGAEDGKQAGGSNYTCSQDSQRSHTIYIYNDNFGPKLTNLASMSIHFCFF